MEVVPADVRAVVTGIFSFGMTNIGGNVPVAIDPVADKYGYRTALLIFFPGCIGASKSFKKPKMLKDQCNTAILGSILFFISSWPLFAEHTAERRKKKQLLREEENS